MPKPLLHQVLVRVRPEPLSPSLMLLRWGTCSMWLSMRSLGSFVAVGQVPGKARRGNHQRVLMSRKKQFSVSSPSVSRPSFESALQKSFEKSGRGEVVAIAAMPQYSKGDTSNNLTVYLYKLLTF